MRDAYTGEAQFLAWGDGPAGPWVKILLPDSEDLVPFRGMTAAKKTMAGQLLAVKIVEVAPESTEQPEAARKTAQEQRGASQQRLSQYAAMLCQDREFYDFLLDTRPARMREAIATGAGSDEASAIVVREVCGVTSRAELDRSPDAAVAFHEHLRKPFAKWREAQG